MLGHGPRRAGFGLPVFRPRERLAAADPRLQVPRRLAHGPGDGRVVRALSARKRPVRHRGGGRAVALHPFKRCRRGYNQSEYIAEGIAAQLGVEVDRRSVRRTRNTASQALKPRRERAGNVEGAFSVRRPERLAGRHVLLVDDVMTTGATLLSCASAILRDAPGCRISIAALAVSQRELGVKE